MLITTRQAADKLKTSTGAVLSLIAAGRLQDRALRIPGRRHYAQLDSTEVNAFARTWRSRQIVPPNNVVDLSRYVGRINRSELAEITGWTPGQISGMTRKFKQTGVGLECVMIDGLNWYTRSQPLIEAAVHPKQEPTLFEPAPEDTLQRIERKLDQLLALWT